MIPSAKTLIWSARFTASDLISSARFEASAASSLDLLVVSETRSESLVAPTESSWVRFAASSARLRALFHKSMPLRLKALSLCLSLLLSVLLQCFLCSSSSGKVHIGLPRGVVDHFDAISYFTRFLMILS